MNETGKEQVEQLRFYVAVEFHVAGDARFLSHHDMMRQIACAVGRAGVPIAWSAGFNPRPKLSLPLPRPVGIASRAELALLRLTEPIDAEHLCQRLAIQMPEGVTLVGCRPLDGVPKLHAAAATFELPLAPSDVEPVTTRITDLHAQASWPCHRPPRKGGKASRDLELRDFVTDLTVTDSVLRFVLVAIDDIWARLAEVLGLLEIDTPHNRCRIVRDSVRWTDRRSQSQCCLAHE